VGAGTIYRYFESKEALITELYCELERKLLEYLKNGYSTADPIRDRFLHVGVALLRYFVANPLYFRYMEQYMNSPFGIALKRDRLMGQTDEDDLFKNLLQEGTSRKDLKELPFFILFALTLGPLIILMRDNALGLISVDDAQILQVVEACWDGVKR
jgi:AcrR family transcriptional regulator